MNFSAKRLLLLLMVLIAQENCFCNDWIKVNLDSIVSVDFPDKPLFKSSDIVASAVMQDDKGLFEVEGVRTGILICNADGLSKRYHDQVAKIAIVGDTVDLEVDANFFPKLGYPALQIEYKTIDSGKISHYYKIIYVQVKEYLYQFEYAANDTGEIYRAQADSFLQTIQIKHSPDLRSYYPYGYHSPDESRQNIARARKVISIFFVLSTLLLIIVYNKKQRSKDKVL